MIKAVDLFCGAGGTSTGLYRACLSTGRKLDLLAINHWPVAIETHRINHPKARHICARIESVRPEDAIPGGHLDLLVASPECTHHSIARGGRPVCDQLRASAWLILRWLESLTVENILIENVREFRDWGPINSNGKLIKSRKGEIFEAFINALRSLNYTVEHRILTAADYGDPTTRQRLFILARRGRRAISWPKKTHGERDLFGDRKPYHTAREIIDWSFPGKSIFTRKKPLAQATLNRIAAGLKKYGGEAAEPFLVMLYGTNDARSVDRPLPTITATGQHIGLAHPFLIHTNHAGGDRCHNIDAPVPTVTCGHRGEMALIEPFVLGQQSCAAPRSVDNPLPAISTAGAISLVEPFITIMKGQSKTRDIDSPIPTITSNPHPYLCEPFLAKYYGKSSHQGVNEPLGTITTKERYGLVEPVSDAEYVYDIRFRMLQPHELAAAMSLDGYRFAGTKTDQVKQIGNAVPASTAEALCSALLQLGEED